jgi:hypothetical protein
MTIICSWCRGEGRSGIVGEKSPLDDRRETHGICINHRISEQARWNPLAPQLDGKRVVLGPDMEPPMAGQFAYLWTGLKNLTRRTRP